jgi:putative oxidoreductase
MFKSLMQCSCFDKCHDTALLVLRVALGAIFVYHGYDKVFVTGIPGVTGFLGGMLHFPAPVFFAYVLSYGELIAGGLLIVGLFTHWAAKYAVIIGAVAFWTVHMDKGFAIAKGGYEFIMLITAAAIAVLVMGAGKYSLDALMHTEEAA